GGRASVAREYVETLAGFTLDLAVVGAGEPAARAFEPALLWGLVEDLAGVELTDEYARRAAEDIGVRGEFIVPARQASQELGAGGDDVRLTRRPHHLVDRRASSAHGDLPRGRAAADHWQRRVERLGQQHRVADVPLADQRINLMAVAPGG